MKDMRDYKPVWKDLSEFELPDTGNGLVDSDQYVSILSDRLIAMSNYYTHLVQFVPDILIQSSRLEAEIHNVQARRSSLLNYYLADQSKIPSTHKRSKDLMVAYVEQNLMKDEFDRIDKLLQKLNDDIVDVQSEKWQLLYRKDVLEKNIEIGMAVLSDMTKKKGLNNGG